jgi:type VI secretion system secreted protein VgrG
MRFIRSTIALLALPVALAGCGHDLDDCVTAPTITFGPAGAPPALSTCTTYVVLAGSGVNCTGTSTVVDGDIGCSPSGNVSGLPPGQPTHGSKHENDSHAAQAQNGCTSAYDDVVARPCNATLGGVDLGGRTFTGGIYRFPTTASCNGTLTLDGQGNSNAVFVFQVGSALSCANNSAIVLTGGAQAKNVFWQVGSNATLGNDCAFKGSLIAVGNITCNQGSSVRGRCLARNGTVTLDDCTVELP